jgi:AbrB family looped-hinge helix DNA binding protein
MGIHTKIAANGRLSVPADIRRRLGLPNGGPVFLEETKDGLVVRSVPQSVARARELYRKYVGDRGMSVDEFIAGRVADSGE